MDSLQTPEGSFCSRWFWVAGGVGVWWNAWAAACSLISFFSVRLCCACPQPWCLVHTGTAPRSSQGSSAVGSSLSCEDRLHHQGCKPFHISWNTGVERQRCGSSVCLNLLEQPEHCFRAGSELSHGEISPQDGSRVRMEAEQSLCEAWLLLHFQMSSLLTQPSPRSRDHQAKQTQLCKTNLVPKSSTATPSFAGKENHCCRCWPSLGAGGLGLLLFLGFWEFGVAIFI